MRESEKWKPVITKGCLPNSDLKLIIWDAVQDCRGEDCGLYDDCPYAKAGKCSIETKYLTNVFNSIVEDIGPSLTQSLLNKISLHIVPLYHQLIKMKMYAYTLNDIMAYTQQGIPKPHPVFREIRDILKCIESTQRSAGLDGEYIRILEGLKPGGTDDPNIWDVGEGHGGYADMLTTKVESDVFPDGKKQGIKRVKRVEEEDEE